MEVRKWVGGGEEILNKRQAQFLDFVHQNIVYYYKHLYLMAPKYRYPLSLSRLCKLCNASHQSVKMAVILLAHTSYKKKGAEIVYQKMQGKKNLAKWSLLIKQSKSAH